MKRGNSTNSNTIKRLGSDLSKNSTVKKKKEPFWTEKPLEEKTDREEEEQLPERVKLLIKYQQRLLAWKEREEPRAKNHKISNMNSDLSDTKVASEVVQKKELLDNSRFVFDSQGVPIDLGTASRQPGSESRNQIFKNRMEVVPLFATESGDKRPSRDNTQSKNK